MISRHVLIAAALLLASAPAAAAKPRFDPAALESIQPGASESDVVALFGKPMRRATLDSGQYELTWVRPGGAVFVTYYTGATLLFSADGKLVRVARTVDTRNR